MLDLVELYAWHTCGMWLTVLTAMNSAHTKAPATVRE